MTAPSCRATPRPISAVTTSITPAKGPYMASLEMIDEDAVYAMKKPRPAQQTAVASPVRNNRRQEICPDSRQYGLHHKKAAARRNCAPTAVMWPAADSILRPMTTCTTTKPKTPASHLTRHATAFQPWIRTRKMVAYQA